MPLLEAKAQRLEKGRPFEDRLQVQLQLTEAVLLVHEDGQHLLWDRGGVGREKRPRADSWPLMKLLSRASDCFPEPPTPTRSALPQGFCVMRQMPQEDSRARQELRSYAHSKDIPKEEASGSHAATHMVHCIVEEHQVHRRVLHVIGHQLCLFMRQLHAPTARKRRLASTQMKTASLLLPPPRPRESAADLGLEGSGVPPTPHLTQLQTLQTLAALTKSAQNLPGAASLGDEARATQRL